MRTYLRVLLIAEVIVCFGPAILMLATGAFILVMSMANGLYSWDMESGSILAVFFMLLLIIAGSCGLYALANVLQQILHPQPDERASWFVRMLLILGVASLAIFSWGDVKGANFTFQYLPLICSMHLIFLSRSYLFGKVLTNKGNG